MKIKQILVIIGKWFSCIFLAIMAVNAHSLMFGPASNITSGVQSAIVFAMLWLIWMKDEEELPLTKK